jgi:hypothetical protein
MGVVDAVYNKIKSDIPLCNDDIRILANTQEILNVIDYRGYGDILYEKTSMEVKHIKVIKRKIDNYWVLFGHKVKRK